jgi:hypothetical protein
MIHRQSTFKQTISIATLYTQSLDDGLYVSPKHVRQKRKMNYRISAVCWLLCRYEQSCSFLDVCASVDSTLGALTRR